MIVVTDFSHYANETLSTQSHGIVHSVYKHTINLLTGGRLLSLQVIGSPASPLSLRTSATDKEFDALKIAPGDEISILQGGMYINGEYFDTSRATLWDAKLHRAQIPQRSGRAQLVADCLRGIIPERGFSDLMLPDGQKWRTLPCAVEAEHILRAVEPLAESSLWSEAARALSELVGLGEGLTPSGDDFLCGVLAAAYLDSRARELCRELVPILRDRLDCTNDISAAFLDCAIQGYFSQPVISLMRGDCLKLLMESFSAIGHSSGADTLSGILFALKI